MKLSDLERYNAEGRGKFAMYLVCADTILSLVIYCPQEVKMLFTVCCRVIVYCHVVAGTVFAYNSARAELIMFVCAA